MMESIEKLREFVDDQFVISGQAYLQGMAIAGSIECEVAERYMLLPVDADGVPWTIADKKFADILGETHTITGILYSSLTGTWYLRDAHDVTHNARQCRHVEPRTIEDVLREFAEKAVCGNQYGSLYADEEEIAKYADELRGMMEVGDD